MDNPKENNFEDPNIYNKRLIVAYHYIKKTFFSNWDKGNKWEIEYLPQFAKWNANGVNEYLKRKNLLGKPFVPDEITSITATCQEFRKCIVFYTLPRSNIDLYAVIIHEICHIGALEHRDKWALNMNAAYYRDNELGMTDLANSIKTDIMMATYNLP